MVSYQREARPGRLNLRNLTGTEYPRAASGRVGASRPTRSRSTRGRAATGARSDEPAMNERGKMRRAPPWRARRLGARGGGWHFDPATGTPFWLELGRAASGFDPRREVSGYDDLDKFGPSRTSGCAAGRCGAGCPRAYADRPIYDLRDRRQHRRAQVAHQHRRLPHRLRDVQRHAARRSSSPRAPTGCRSGPPARAGCAWPSSTWPSIAAASASWWTSTRAG